MRSRSLQVPQVQPQVDLHAHPFIVGQTGIIYRIFDKIGSGSFGSVFDVRIVSGGNSNRQQNDEPAKLVVKIIDASDESFVELDYITELQILKDIKISGSECFSQLEDWGETEVQNTYQIQEIKNKSKFILQNKLGKGVNTIFYKHKKNFKKMDVLKLGI